MSSYNITRFTRQVLKRHRKAPPSLILHLYPTHFRFEHQHGNYNYDSPMKCFLEAIREQKLPTDLLDVLDQARVRYYDGCLIVEVHDHRSAPPTATATAARAQLSFQLSHTRDQPSTSKAEVYRIVLGPNPATLWTELGIMNERQVESARAADDESIHDHDGNEGWTEEEAVELEAMILARTAPPLCLSPSLQTNRLANIMLRATTLRPPKRKRTSTLDGADQEGEALLRKEREERERMMKIGDEGVGRPRANAFARLSFIQSYRDRSNINNIPVAVAPTPVAPPPVAAPSIRLIASVSGPTASSSRHHQAPITVAAGSPTASESSRTVARLKKKKINPGDSDGGTPVSAAISVKKTKKKAARADSPDVSLDPTEREKREGEKKKAAALKKSNSKLKQEKKRKEAESAIGTSGQAGGAGAQVVWSNGKPVYN